MGCGQIKTKDVDSPQLYPNCTGRLTIKSSTFVGHKRGSIFDEYEISDIIGTGAFAQVKKAVHRQTRNVRAVKIIHKAGVQQDQIDSKHRLREVKILSELDHPNILRVFDIFEDRMRFYVVMEYCEGGELFTRLTKQKTFSERDASKIMFQVFSAVCYCHERFVIHRDLKPENLLFEESSGELDLKIADFGSSAFLDVHQKLNGVFGSPYYVAPEVLKQSYNEKCDLWSCGIIMYVLLTGKPPYRGRNEREIMQFVSRGELTLKYLHTVSTEAQDLINHLLVLDLKSRFSAKQALEHRWIQDYRSSQNTPSPALPNALAELRGFHNSTKLKDAIQTYIATQIVSQADLKELRDAFLSIDLNGDGLLSREELLTMYRHTLGEAEARKEVEEIMKNVDSDQSGFIDYSEFLKASLDKTKHLSKQTLEMTFRLFDLDGNGTISIEELKTMMGGSDADDETWREVIREVDENGDGLIDLKEFEDMIQKRM